MNAGGLIGGLIGAVIGGAIWVVVGLTTDYQTGWAALLLGILVGAGVQGGTQRRGGVTGGLVAAALTVAAIAGARFVLFHAVRSSIDPEQMIVEEIAWELAIKYEQAGVEVFYPTDDSVPPEMWDEAVANWNASDDETRQAALAGVEAGFGADAFLEAAFKPLDAVFILLAIATAFKLASIENEEAVVDVGFDDEQPKLPPHLRDNTQSEDPLGDRSISDSSDLAA